MSATPSPRSPLARLVLFIFCLAFAAGILAAAHYLVIDLPAQENVQVPENTPPDSSDCAACNAKCATQPEGIYVTCVQDCRLLEC